MKKDFLLIVACTLCLLVACTKDTESVINTDQTEKETFIGIPDDGTFDRLLNLDGLKFDNSNTIEIMTYSVEYYNRHFSITINLRAFAGSSYFVLKPNGGKPATIDVIRVPYGSELGQIISNIFNSKVEFFNTKNADEFAKWVADKTKEGLIVVSTYNKTTGVYSGAALTQKEWDVIYGDSNAKLNIKYYDRTK